MYRHGLLRAFFEKRAAEVAHRGQVVLIEVGTFAENRGDTVQSGLPRYSAATVD